MQQVIVAERGGKGIWEDHMISPLGRPTGSPWVMGTLLVHGVGGDQKMASDQESMMALLSLVGLLEGTIIQE